MKWMYAYFDKDTLFLAVGEKGEKYPMLICRGTLLKIKEVPVKIKERRREG